MLGPGAVAATGGRQGQHLPHVLRPSLQSPAVGAGNAQQQPRAGAVLHQEQTGAVCEFNALFKQSCMQKCGRFARGFFPRG